MPIKHKRCLCGKRRFSEEHGTSESGVNMWELTPLIPVAILPVGLGLRSHTLL